MDSFYGGKRGFSFILRPNPDDVNGYWQTSSAIEAAAQSKILKQGEYAIITETGVAYSENHGKIYRITKDSNIELIGKIGNPAPLYGLEITDDLNGADDVQFYFLNDNASKEAEGFKVYWKLNKDEHDQPISIGIGFEFPHPVFEVTNIPANYFQSIENQVEAQRPAGISISSNNTKPVYYQVKNVIPSATYIGSEEDRKNLNALNLNLGDLWMETVDDSYKIIKITQITDDIKEMFKILSEDENDDSIKFLLSPNNGQPLVIFPYQTYDGRAMWDALEINFEAIQNSFSVPKLKYSIDSTVQTSKALMLNLAFENNKYKEASPFTHFDLYAKTINDDMIVIQGKIGEPCNLNNFVYFSSGENISEEDLAENIVIIKLDLYGTYDSTQHMGSVHHQNFLKASGPFSIFLINENNTTGNILETMKSFGITWYPPDSEVE